MLKKKGSRFSSCWLCLLGFGYGSGRRAKLCSNWGCYGKTSSRSPSPWIRRKKTAVPQKTTLTAIDNLLEEAGYCAAVARAGGTSGDDRQRFIMEWHSVNQWLSRIAGFIALNVREDFSMDWKKEYELFLEVYELTN